MTSRVEPQWAVIIRDAIRDAVFDLHTGLPAKVVTFNANKQTCDVQPLLKRTYFDPDDEGGELTADLPIIPNVPVVYPAGGGWSITFPLQADDTVYLAFAERSLDRWKDAQPGQSVDELDATLHPLTGAVALPGLRPRTNALAGLATGGLRLGKEDGSTEIFIDDTGRVTIKSALIDLGDQPTEAAVLGNALLQYIANFILVFNAHLHPTAAPGAPSPPQLLVPVPPDFAIPVLPPLPDLLSQVVKVK